MRTSRTGTQCWNDIRCASSEDTRAIYEITEIGTTFNVMGNFCERQRREPLIFKIRALSCHQLQYIFIINNNHHTLFNARKIRYIPLINISLVRSVRMASSSYGPSFFYGPIAKRASLENKEGKNEDP